MLVTLKTLAAIEILLIFGLCVYRFALAQPYKDVVSAKAAALVLLTPAVALFGGNIYLFYAYLVAAVAFTSRTRAELCGTYVLMMPSMPLLALESAAGGVYLLPLSVSVMMNVGALIGFVVTPRPAGIARPRYDWAVLLLIVMFTFIFGRDVSASSIVRTLVIYVIGCAGPYFLLSRGLSSRDGIDRTLLRLGLAATLGAVVGVFEMVKHWVLFQSFYDAMHVPLPMLSATLNMRGGMLRTGGPIIDYTAAGVFLAVVLAVIPHLLPRFRPIWRWGIVLLLVAGLFATQSRGAWIAALVGVLVVLAYRGAWMKVAGIAGSALVAQIAVFAVLGSDSRLAESLGKSGASAMTADYRKQLLARGLNQVAAHPLFGQPPRALTQSMDDLVQGQHIVDFVNTHLYVAMVAGVPFFLGWLLVWTAPVVRSWRLRHAAPAGANLAELPAAIIPTVMVALMFTSPIDRNLLWPIIALGIAGPCFAFAGKRQGTSAPSKRRKLIYGLPGDQEGKLVYRLPHNNERSSLDRGRVPTSMHSGR